MSSKRATNDDSIGDNDVYIVLDEYAATPTLNTSLKKKVDKRRNDNVASAKTASSILTKGKREEEEEERRATATKPATAATMPRRSR